MLNKGDLVTCFVAHSWTNREQAHCLRAWQRIGQNIQKTMSQDLPMLARFSPFSHKIYFHQQIMTYPRLFFGVELELNIACTYPDTIPDNTSDPRAFQFKVAEAAITQTLEPYFTDPYPIPTYDQVFNGSDISHTTYKDQVMTTTIRNSIIKTLTAAGLPIDQDPYAKTKISNWGIERDESIRPPRDDQPYEWCGIELVSPAYEFNPENLLAVQKMCSVLTTNYLTDTNENTGLHVHVSFGLDKTWEFRSLKTLLMFLWAFEPQFDSLHPANRQMKDRGSILGYAKSMRASSLLALEFWDEFQREIPPLQGLVKLERFKESQMVEMLRAVSGEGSSRYMAYNVATIIDLLTEDRYDKAKPTVEFRQHEGTLDGNRIVQWVSLWCGVIKFLETAQPTTITKLLKLATNEKWTKTGDPSLDDRNEWKYGKIPAEDNFTIINLLERIGVQESADFYRTRTYPIEGTPPLCPVARYKWKHEERRPVLSEIDRAIQARAQALKEIREDMDMIDRFHKPAGWSWDPDHAMWPAHEKIEYDGEVSWEEECPEKETTDWTSSGSDQKSFDAAGSGQESPEGRYDSPD